MEQVNRDSQQLVYKTDANASGAIICARLTCHTPVRQVYCWLVQRMGYLLLSPNNHTGFCCFSDTLYISIAYFIQYSAGETLQYHWTLMQCAGDANILLAQVVSS